MIAVKADVYEIAEGYLADHKGSIGLGPCSCVGCTLARHVLATRAVVEAAKRYEAFYAADTLVKGPMPYMEALEEAVKLREEFDDMRDRSGMDFDLDDDTKNEILATWACIIHRRAPSEAVGLLRDVMGVIDTHADYRIVDVLEHNGTLDKIRRFLAAQEKA